MVLAPAPFFPTRTDGEVETVITSIFLRLVALAAAGYARRFAYVRTSFRR
jgi:hypothetical protein